METEKSKPVPETTAESFEKIVQESKADLAAQADAQVKRERGRPLGSKNKKGRENEPTDAPSDGKKVEVEVLPDGRPALDIKPLAKDAIKIPFAIAAVKMNQPELDVDDKDVETPTYYLDRVFNFHLPGLEKQDPKKFAIILFLFSVAMLVTKKILVGIEKRKQNQINHSLPREGDSTGDPGPHAPAPVQASSSPLPGSGAREFFKGRH